MKYRILTTLLILAATTVSAQEWEPLFNGKNLKGWKRVNGQATYKVGDGTIVGTARMDKTNTFLITEKNYGNFILELEFKVDDYLNSGVQIRSASDKNYKDGIVYGYQVEIDPSERGWTGGVYDESRRFWLYPVIYNPSARTAFHNGEWNTMRIEAIGPEIRTWVNGTAVTNLWDDMDATGFIGLQVHAVYKPEDVGLQVRWRNIRICTQDVERYRTVTAAPEVNGVVNTLTPAEQADGWKLLWDGQTTQGWRGAKLDHFPREGWKIEGGILKAMKGDGGESALGGDIVTERTYRNFILKVDFKITDRANSGIKYFVDPELNKGAGSAIGCEFQILDDAGVKGNRKLGALYDLIPALTDKPFYKNEFNTAMIIVRGNHVEHWLNNVKIVEYERNSQLWNALVAFSKYVDWPSFGNATEGHILLQDHGDEVWFRNIKIKELP